MTAEAAFGGGRGLKETLKQGVGEAHSLLGGHAGCSTINTCRTTKWAREVEKLVGGHVSSRDCRVGQ